MTEAEIFEHLKAVLTSTFEIDPARVTTDANLFADLDLDSIDAVDLAIKLQEFTGKRVKPQEFKSIRTVGDVVTTVRQLLAG
ncbi:MAG TPA: acyl carrier protein [Burkholderiales bacterium]|nr:acyl carrier protein [Burkholderiales bacterium]